MGPGNIFVNHRCLFVSISHGGISHSSNLTYSMYHFMAARDEPNASLACRRVFSCSKSRCLICTLQHNPQKSSGEHRNLCGATWSTNSNGGDKPVARYQYQRIIRSNIMPRTRCRLVCSHLHARASWLTAPDYGRKGAW